MFVLTDENVCLCSEDPKRQEAHGPSGKDALAGRKPSPWRHCFSPTAVPRVSESQRLFRLGFPACIIQPPPLTSPAFGEYYKGRQPSEGWLLLCGRHSWKIPSIPISLGTHRSGQGLQRGPEPTTAETSSPCCPQFLTVCLWAIPCSSVVARETTGAGSATAVGTGVLARGAREDKVCELGGLGRERERRGARQPARQETGPTGGARRRVPTCGEDGWQETEVAVAALLRTLPALLGHGHVHLQRDNLGSRQGRTAILVRRQVRASAAQQRGLLRRGLRHVPRLQSGRVQVGPGALCRHPHAGVGTGTATLAVCR